MNVYKKLFAYAREKVFLGYLAILLSSISVLFTIWGYYLIYKFLYNLIMLNDLAMSEEYAVKIVVVLTTGAILYILSGIFSHMLGFRLETNLRKRGIEGLSQASFRFFDMNPSGKVRKIIDDNASQTHTVVAHLIPDNAQAFLTPILAIILGFLISTRVGLVLAILTLLAGLLLFSMMGEQKFMKIYQESLADLSAETVEYVRGIQVVKIFGASVESFKSLYNAIKNYSKYAYEYSLSCRKPYVLYQLIFFGLVAILLPIVVYATDMLGDSDMLLVELLMAFFLSGVLFVAFMRIMWVSMYVFQGNYAVDTLEGLYEDMQRDKMKHGEHEIFKDFNIEFDHVSFGYNDNMVIEDLSFRLGEGKTYALVGSSGSGKSTIAKLISGFYNVDRGEIRIGGVSLNDYSNEAIINNISFVFQNAKLFKTSIYENVALAKRDAKREEVMEALRLAGCQSIIDKFKTAEETVIGSKGVYLSGGEKQRIAIARAILKNANIVIMDEASASIDPDNEFELQKAFKNLMKNKTVIMIAHRLSSIREVDEILVLDEGKIVERGSDEELMSKESKYKKLQEMYGVANEWRVGNEAIL